LLLRGLYLTKAHPLEGEGLGGGDAAEFVSDRPMDAVEVCQDLVVPKTAEWMSLRATEPPREPGKVDPGGWSKTWMAGTSPAKTKFPGQRSAFAGMTDNQLRIPHSSRVGLLANYGPPLEG
jgi:hypothetical protein